jgi:hypothetical protein
LTVFFDWTNILGKPYRSDIVRVNYNTAGAVTGTEIFPMIVRYEETVFCRAASASASERGPARAGPEARLRPRAPCPDGRTMRGCRDERA